MPSVCARAGGPVPAVGRVFASLRRDVAALERVALHVPERTRDF